MVSCQILQRLPIFPLPGAVLLPGGLLPLHIFEPRYRKMVRDVLEGEHLIGMAMPLAEEQLGAPPPPLAPTVGVGRIIANQELPDGRFHLVLRGEARVRIEREIVTDEPYRMVVACLVPDVLGSDVTNLATSETTVRALANNLASLLPEGGDALRKAVAGEPNLAALVDLLGAALVNDPDDRQTLLETPEVEIRMDFITRHLATLLAHLGSPSRAN